MKFGAEPLQRFAERVVKITAVDVSAAVVSVFKDERSVAVVVVKDSSHPILP